ncbi:MAG: hypothetical protein H0T56_12490 [Pseudaminobacter sp.]|nr:hypothetical protein [Pseudaminobacter sp.]
MIRKAKTGDRVSGKITQRQPATDGAAAAPKAPEAALQMKVGLATLSTFMRVAGK